MTVATKPGEPLEGANVLRGEKLFGKWQEQGEALGWGPRQAAALMGNGKRHRCQGCLPRETGFWA